MLARPVGLQLVVIGRPRHEPGPFAAAIERHPQPGELIERRGHDHDQRRRNGDLFQHEGSIASGLQPPGVRMRYHLASTPNRLMTLRETTPPDGFERTGVVARMALALTAWTEHWVPDAFVFALVGTIIVVIAGTAATPSSLAQVIDAWGNGFWELIPFTLQMSLIIITGHVLATSAPMSRLIRVLAAWPRTPKSAVAMVTFFALASRG